MVAIDACGVAFHRKLSKSSLDQAAIDRHPSDFMHCATAIKFSPKSWAAFLLGVFGAVLLLPGCATKTNSAAGTTGKIVLTEDEYEYVSVTGSRVPVRVRKNSSASTASAQTGSALLTVAPGALERSIDRELNTGGR